MIKKVKPSMIMILLLAIMITGCGNPTNQNDQAFGFMQGYGTDDNNRVINKQGSANPEPYTRYGFQRTSAEAIGHNEFPGYAIYDRSLLAESISEMGAVIPNVYDIGVLVTDQHVLMVYESAALDHDERDEVAEQVRQTARSVVPAYYDIYVSDDLGLIAEIERFKGQSSRDQDLAGSLEETIQRMSEYPQGKSSNMDNGAMEETREAN